jgi:hypothetical protein
LVVVIHSRATGAKDNNTDESSNRSWAEQHDARKSGITCTTRGAHTGGGRIGGSEEEEEEDEADLKAFELEELGQ